MIITNLENKINELWDNSKTDANLISDVMHLLDTGQLRIAEKYQNSWHVNEYLKKAVLLYFKYSNSQLGQSEYGAFFDKIPLKTAGWDENDFAEAKFRMTPGAIVRYSAYIAPSVVLMPSFVNVATYVGKNSMIDSHALVGSCAQIGENCHISDGVTIGGVLEPVQANPVIIEDGCFIGAKSVVTEGVIVGEGSILAAGTILSQSVKIVNRDTNEISYGYVPPHSVVVPGTYRSTDTINIGCAVIVKTVSAETKEKTSINELLRGL